MCSHVWKRIEDTQFCVRCGLTRLPNGQMFFDRKLPNYKSKRKKAVKKQ
jgi:hypothetical protein